LGLWTFWDAPRGCACFALEDADLSLSMEKLHIPGSSSPLLPSSLAAAHANGEVCAYLAVGSVDVLRAAFGRSEGDVWYFDFGKRWCFRGCFGVWALDAIVSAAERPLE